MGWGRGNRPQGDPTPYSSQTRPEIPATDKQYGVITDLLCAGEIEGVVGGLSGIYLNGVSLMDKTEYNSRRMRVGTATVSGTSVTSANNLFNNIDLSKGSRYLQILSSGPTGNLNTMPAYSNQFKVKKGVGMVFVPNGFINTDYTFEPGTTNKNNIDLDVSARIRIPGAGTDGNEYVGVITGVGTHQTYGDYIQISPKPSRDLSASSTRTFEIDTVHKISSISNANTATLATSVTRGVTQGTAILSQAQSFYKTDSDKLNYDNTYAFVRRGTRYQKPISKTSRYGS